MNDSFVKIHNTSKQFVKDAPFALQSLTASINKGQIIGVVGPDGAGKTTLIRLIAGLLKPTEGSITVAGFDTMNDAEKVHELLGYMPQKFGLYEDLTVEQNLNFYADLRGVKREERKETFEKLLAFTALGPFTKRLAGALSGGMKQKLGLACALLKKPSLLLLDEPSVGVDPISRRQLWSMTYELLQEGISVVWSTAYLEEAERCHTVLLLNEGKMLFLGPPHELTSRVQGRTYHIKNFPNKREVLTEVLHEESVIDGIIQASDVRVVLKEPTNKLGNYLLTATAARFEDAFMDILGGVPKGESPLATAPATMPKSEIMIDTNQLTKRFGSFTAVDHVSLKIKAGEIFGLLGPNGAGKTTTFKLLCGLLKPTSGEAFVNGVDLRLAPSAARSHIGYMAQKFSLYGILSVQENLEFFSGIYNLVGKERTKAIDMCIEMFDLKEHLTTPADLLPLGFKQRLALSCAVMHRPEILFLDEPTSGVDPIVRREFWGHINSLVDKGVTILITTHFMDEAEYCDRIGLIYRSKLITIGTPEELKEKAQSSENPSPTLEDAFIRLIECFDEVNHAS